MTPDQKWVHINCRVCFGRLFLATVFSLFFTSVVSAAEFTELSNRPIPINEKESGTCTHKMEGEILAGDAAKLALVIQNLPGQDHDDLNFIMCMNSRGGRLSEGLEIGELLRGAYFGTYVPEGAECLSACAIAFMHGSVSAWEYVLTFRMLHPRGKLGFHAPSLSIAADSNQMVPYALVQGAYQATMDTVSKIVSGAATSVSDFASPIIPLSLLSEMLSVGSDDFVYVDNLHKAFMWDVTIFPKNLTTPPEFDLEVGLYQLCENSGYMIDPNSYDMNPPRALNSNYIMNQQISYHWTVEMPNDHKLLSLENIWNRQCSYKYRSKEGDFEVRRYVDGKLEREVSMPPVYLFAPETKLTELAPKL